MFTSDTNKPDRGAAGRTALIYLGVTVLCISFDRIYALFSHGVSSPYMSLMFLYPLMGGAAVYFLLWLTAPRARENRNLRLAEHCYNPGIAALTVGSALRGILDIAGTTSPYTPVYVFFGWTMTGLGLLIYGYGLFGPRREADV